MSRKTANLNQKYFRKGRHDVTFINFVLTKGGLGDYINWMPAFEWLAAENPHIHGRLLIAPPFYDIAKHIMRKVS